MPLPRAHACVWVQCHAHKSPDGCSQQIVPEQLCFHTLLLLYLQVLQNAALLAQIQQLLMGPGMGSNSWGLFDREMSQQIMRWVAELGMVGRLHGDGRECMHACMHACSVHACMLPYLCLGKNHLPAHTAAVMQGRVQTDQCKG